MGHQVIGMLMMLIFLDMMSDIMKQRRIFQPFPLGLAHPMNRWRLIKQTHGQFSRMM